MKIVVFEKIITLFLTDTDFHDKNIIMDVKYTTS